MRRVLVGTATAVAVIAVPVGATAALLSTPLFAEGGTVQGGDLPTAERGAQVADEGEGQAMRPVANLQYDRSGEAQAGSDIEFVRVGERDFALAGTLRKGMQIVNISDPREPRRVAVYDCAITQGDVQVWDKGERILASYTADSTFGAAGAASQCAEDLDLDSSAAGTVIVDITRPAAPRTVGFAPVDRGSHNMTVHPSGNYLYNSNSDLITSTQPSIDVFDIRRPAHPRQVADLPIPFVPASLGSESHDIAFNEAGTRAYSAALSQQVVLDTSDPADPEIVSSFTDPAINV